MSDGREYVAKIFERTANLAASTSASAPDPGGAALKVAAVIASAVAGLIRTLGIEDTKKAIDELVARRDEGKITDDHVARDNEEIAAAVADMYADGEAKPKRKRSSKK